MRHSVEMRVRGPWSLATSRGFWEGFTPAKLDGQEGQELRTVFRVEADWSRAAASVRQDGDVAVVMVEGDGDLDAAAAQVGRFLALDVDATGWPQVGRRDEVIGEAQQALPGLRPCGFHSPYEAAVWAVLSQRVQMAQAAIVRAGLVHEYGEDGAFPAPTRLRTLPLDLPIRKAEYLRAVADAALDGMLDGEALRQVDPEQAVNDLQAIKGIGPFAAELIVSRGANVPDALPQHEPRLRNEVRERYGRALEEVADGWRPFRTWAAVHIRVLSGRYARRSARG
jgi:DNA-3-methyladenine glycosylase II